MHTAVIFAHINKPLKGRTANKNISLVHNVYIPLLIFQGPMKLLLFSYAIYLFRMKPDIFRWNVKVNTAVEVPPFPADFLSWGFMHIQTHTYTYTHTAYKEGSALSPFPSKAKPVSTSFSTLTCHNRNTNRWIRGEAQVKRKMQKYLTLKCLQLWIRWLRKLMHGWLTATNKP